MSDERLGPGHHAECIFVPYEEIAKDWPDLPEDWDPEWAKQAGVVKCHEECPRLVASIKRGLELAERLGWP